MDGVHAEQGFHGSTHRRALGDGVHGGHGVGPRRARERFARHPHPHHIPLFHDALPRHYLLHLRPHRHRRPPRLHARAARAAVQHRRVRHRKAAHRAPAASHRVHHLRHRHVLLARDAVRRVRLLLHRALRLWHEQHRLDARHREPLRQRRKRNLLLRPLLHRPSPLHGLLRPARQRSAVVALDQPRLPLQVHLRRLFAQRVRGRQGPAHSVPARHGPARLRRTCRHGRRGHLRNTRLHQMGKPRHRRRNRLHLLLSRVHLHRLHVPDPH
mmetsp:Transcript_7734/g.25663  ORF Transcript_7734/g.25663 Transcript_7734/m.25663 type:complete len:270 (+) Transcript_7734:1101-1910(+)